MSTYANFCNVVGRIGYLCENLVATLQLRKPTQRSSSANANISAACFRNLRGGGGWKPPFHGLRGGGSGAGEGEAGYGQLSLVESYPVGGVLGGGGEDVDGVAVGIASP